LPRTSDSGSIDTRVHIGLGDATVIVPESANVTVTCETDLGDVNCLDRQQSGVDTGEVTVTDEGTKGSAGLDVELSVTAGTGSVEVRRG
jgi:predicted membrane protein